MAGVIGAAGGIGGFYLPVVLGIARDTTGRYGSGFLFLGAVSTLAFVVLFALRSQWLTWAMPERDVGAPGGEFATAE
jgi:MFS transporter, NNP family, nitrate/nitrite transporter